MDQPLIDQEAIVENINPLCYWKNFGSAFAFGFTSFMLTVVNKTVLTTYHFPSFLVVSIGQMTASIFLLGIGKQLNIIEFPDLTSATIHEIFPLPILFLGNMIFGLGGTQAISLPMFAALRRVVILMTMLLEFKLIGIKQPMAVQISVYLMVTGAILAVGDNLSFSLYGYTLVMIANVFTAVNDVIIKMKLNNNNIGKYGLIYYNSLVVIGPTFLGTWLVGDFNKVYAFREWSNPLFIVYFVLSCIMGFLLMYSSSWCIQENSALTTSAVGGIKNVCISYFGMFIGNDYLFSKLNFSGINISVFGSLLYSYQTFARNVSVPKSDSNNITDDKK